MVTTAHENGSRGRVTALYRYPVKGLTPEALEAVDLETGCTFPFDRAYAIENGKGRFDPHAPAYLPKINFLMLMRDERLATLRTTFEADSHTLTVFRDGRQVARGQMSTAIGRNMIEQFFASYMQKELRGAPKIVSGGDHTFSDVPAKCVHLVNLASLRELERVAGTSIDALRFRANIYFDGLEPWSEFSWLDRSLACGSVSLKVFDRTQRCEATNVDPSRGVRDLSIPALLQRNWGHSDFGVYAKVTGACSIRPGDPIELS